MHNAFTAMSASASITNSMICESHYGAVNRSTHNRIILAIQAPSRWPNHKLALRFRHHAHRHIRAYKENEIAGPVLLF